MFTNFPESRQDRLDSLGSERGKNNKGRMLLVHLRRSGSSPRATQRTRMRDSRMSEGEKEGPARQRRTAHPRVVEQAFRVLPVSRFHAEPHPMLSLFAFHFALRRSLATAQSKPFGRPLLAAFVPIQHGSPPLLKNAHLTRYYRLGRHFEWKGRCWCSRPNPTSVAHHSRYNGRVK